MARCGADLWTCPTLFCTRLGNHVFRLSALMLIFVPSAITAADDPASPADWNRKQLIPPRQDSASRLCAVRAGWIGLRHEGRQGQTALIILGYCYSDPWRYRALMRQRRDQSGGMQSPTASIPAAAGASLVPAGVLHRTSSVATDRRKGNG